MIKQDSPDNLIETQKFAHMLFLVSFHKEEPFYKRSPHNHPVLENSYSTFLSSDVVLVDREFSTWFTFCENFPEQPGLVVVQRTEYECLRKLVTTWFQEEAAIKKSTFFWASCL